MKRPATEGVVETEERLGSISEFAAVGESLHAAKARARAATPAAVLCIPIKLLRVLRGRLRDAAGPGSLETKRARTADLPGRFPGRVVRLDTVSWCGTDAECNVRYAVG
jgi:hypothetical protein